MPPKVAHKIQHAVKSLDESPVKRRRLAKKIVHVPAPQTHSEAVVGGGFPKKELLIGGAVIACLLGAYLFGWLGRVTVQIFPMTQTLDFEEKVSTDVSYENVNLLKKIIPARMLIEEKQSSQEFLATGSASNDGKAAGTIIVYNKISPASPLTLKSGTHFLSDGGKYFVSLGRIVVPAMKSGADGSIEVSVQAEESGQEYNIGSSKFSVPGLSGTSYYYSVWAESKTAMGGGYTGDVKKVSKSDIISAKDAIAKKLLEDAESALKNNISSDEILLDGALISNIIEVATGAKEGAIQDKFNATARVKISALVFKKDDVQKFTKLDAQSKLDEESVVLEESLAASYTADSIDVQAGIAKINLKVSGKAHHIIDEHLVADALTQKNAGQIKEIINRQYGAWISSVRVRFWPFWVTKVPRDKNKIKVELVFP